ncbi:zinc ribbon domain-containing protein [Pyxidicoccus sp. 3LG]
MRCPECGEASDPRLKYCENCGAKMPERPQQATGSRPALRGSRPSRASHEPAYAAEILDEVDEHSRPHAVGGAPELPPEDKTDPGQSHGPKWLAYVPAHSPSVLGVGLLGLAMVLSIIPFLSGAGVPGTLLALVAGALLVTRELREAGEAPGLTQAVPQVLLRPEVAAASTVVLAAVAVKMLGLGLLPLLWVAGAGLVAWDQWRKVLAGQEGTLSWFEPRRLLRMPDVVALAGVALCLLTMFTTWDVVSTAAAPLPENAPMPEGPPELRVINPTRPSDDVLYTRGAEVAARSGWDLPASVVVELLLLAVLALLALRPEVERPSWARFAPAAAVGFCLVWAAANMRLALGPITFVIGLGAVGFLAVQQLRGGRSEPVYADEDPVDETEE